MTSTENAKALERELDSAAVLWKASQTEGNEGAARTHLNRLWLLVFKRFEPLPDIPGEDPNAIISAMEEALGKYSPEKGAFSHYFSVLLSGRKADAARYAERHAPSSDSLDRTVAEDGDLTLGSMVAADKRLEPESAIGFDGLFAELTSLVLNFAERQNGRKYNENRRMWHRLFYTEDMTQVMKEHTFRFLHERDIFSAMDTAYLDYYMTCVCRSGQAVQQTPLKPYGQVVPSRSETAPVPLPIPGDVSLAYLQTKGVSVGNSARSQQKNYYEMEKSAIYRPEIV